MTSSSVFLGAPLLLLFAVSSGCDVARGPASKEASTRMASRAQTGDKSKLTPAALESLVALGYVEPQGSAPAGKTTAAVEQDRAASPLEAMQAARRLIRKGQLAIEIPDYGKAAELATRIAEGHGGYVADSQTTRTDNGKRRGQITLRVVAGRFEQAVAALKALGRVDSESVGAEDITKAYADLETRLRVKREAEARLREILRARTARLSDILEAEAQLTRLIEEIEQMEGERRFYDQQVALSTITIQLYEPEAVVRPALFDPIRKALRESLELLAASVAALIGLVVVATPWLLVALLVWRVTRAARRRVSREQKAASVSS